MMTDILQSLNLEIVIGIFIAIIITSIKTLFDLYKSYRETKLKKLGLISEYLSLSFLAISSTGISNDHHIRVNQLSWKLAMWMDITLYKKMRDAILLGHPGGIKQIAIDIRYEIDRSRFRKILSYRRDRDFSGEDIQHFYRPD